MHQKILIPPTVHAELCLGSNCPGAKQLAEAMEQDWLQIQNPSVRTSSSLSELILILDQGEAETIVLAEEGNCKFLLIDDRKDRTIAKRRGVPIVGIAGILLAAKKRELVDEVLPIVKSLEGVGYRISATLVKEIAKLAGESE